MCRCMLAVHGMAGTEGGAVHIAEVHAAAPITRHQHTALCSGRGCTLPDAGPIHSLRKLSSAAHGIALTLLLFVAIYCH